MRQQNLRRFQSMRPEAAFIGLDQAHLADGGGGLKFAQGFGPFAPAQTLDAFGNGATGNQHDFLVQRGELGDLLRPQSQAGMIEAATIVGDQTTAYLHDQALGAGNDRSAHSASSSDSSSDADASNVSSVAANLINLAGSWCGSAARVAST